MFQLAQVRLKNFSKNNFHFRSIQSWNKRIGQWWSSRDFSRRNSQRNSRSQSRKNFLHRYEGKCSIFNNGKIFSLANVGLQLLNHWSNLAENSSTSDSIMLDSCQPIDSLFVREIFLKIKSIFVVLLVRQKQWKPKKNISMIYWVDVFLLVSSKIFND